MFLAKATLFAFLAAAVQAGWDYGAPCMVQHTLRPNSIVHGSPVTITDSPYTLTITDVTGAPTKYYRPGVSYRVRLDGIIPFKSFLLQPRLATREGHIIGHLRAGYFIEDGNWNIQGVKIQQCPPIFNNSLTNTNTEEKYVVEVRWQVDRNYGPIQFFLTILQENTVYWERWQPESGFIIPDRSGKSSDGQLDLNQPPPLAGTGGLPLIEPKPALSNVQQVQPSIDSQPPVKPSDGQTPVNVAIDTDTFEGSGESEPETATKPNRPFIDIQVGTGDIEIEGSGEEKEVGKVVKYVEEEDPIRTTIGPDDHPTSINRKNPVDFVEFHEEQQENFLEYEVTEPTTTTTTTTEAKKVERHILEPRTGRLLTFSVELQEYCESNPCQNSGICTNLKEEFDFICECSSSYTGKRCDKVNHCANHRCLNGALCKNNEDGYTCECQGEWAGKFCQRDCPSYLCDNGGSCVINEKTNDFGCKCVPGYGGKKCEYEVNECKSGPCKNGAKCTDKFNAYECTCRDGYMGENCHRPCQNIYQSCNRWQRENRCVTMRTVTRFFDVNCAVTCDQCAFKNRTVRTDKPMPPILEPFAYIIGRWVANSSNHYRFPVDFDETTTGYVETLEFSVPPVPMFGTPSINISAKAVSNDDEIEQWTTGFMTLNGRHKKGRPFDIAYMHTGNDGITFVEEGTLERKEMRLKIKYSTVFPRLQSSLPDIEKSVRTFTQAGPWLQETVKKINSDGSKSFFSKFYYRVNKFLSY